MGRRSRPSARADVSWNRGLGRSIRVRSGRRPLSRWVPCQGTQILISGREIGGGSNGWKEASSSRTERSEEHTSELQSLAYLVCRLLLEKKKTDTYHSCVAELSSLQPYASMCYDCPGLLL